jgi:hypothetical protein
MTKIISWHRGRRAAIVGACGCLFLGACDANKELLQPQQPGVISPEAVANATAANALWVGALGRWKAAMDAGEGIWNWEGLFTDEMRSVDTFTQRQNADQRNLQTDDSVLLGIYNAAQQARGRARDAINALLAYDPSATGKQHVGEMYLMMGYIEMEMSEAFCNGIPFGETAEGVPHYTAPLTNADGFKLAISRIDTALTYLTGTDAGSVNIKYAAFVTKARALVDLGDFPGAAAAVASVPTSFQYNFTFSQTTSDNAWWTLGASRKGYSAGDSTDIGGQILNAIPFARLNDPRVSITDTHTKAEDNVSNFVNVNDFGRDDPIPVLSGIDARLIEAEAKLQANDIPGMLTILNTLRTSPQVLGVFKVPAMSALPVPADKTSATDLFFREKALWQFQRGYRMDDLRRQVRQYGRAQDKVFPSGDFTSSAARLGKYGAQVAFPVPDYEKVNPNFHGCIDTKA